MIKSMYGNNINMSMRNSKEVSKKILTNKYKGIIR
jgi:hypothetical protein